MTISPKFRWQRRLVIMLKEPRAGRVKTRLGQDIGMTSAAWWFRHQTASLLRRIQNPYWQTVLAVAPDHAGLTSRAWPAHLPRIPQGRGDLGDRMGRVFDTLPPGPICVIGGDIPDVTQGRIRRAFDQLGQHDAVFGPAPDGGYWLIGLKRQSPSPTTMFQGVRWSSQYALCDTVATLPDCKIGYADTLRDVDTAADLAPRLT